jgi:hypothetical protein
MSDLKPIEDITTRYATARGQLTDAVIALNQELDAVKRKHMPTIKRKLAVAAGFHNDLDNAIRESAHCFHRPRSVVIMGIRVGMQKSKGLITWDNDDQVVKLIRKHCPDEFDLLVKTTETPVKAALAQKSAADLKRIGVTVSGAGDEVLIKPVDGAVDKLVAALMKDATGEGE